ncbi:hypothetical protein FNU76_17420 [Chitinimonas arctica]|uniref:Protein phosphatase 2C domain-containing protein n=1 Tax=Chitinimonas arctica TaxID=2594795 RepID=A0A516SIK5_9NEIS|nr:hypothetical protein [Chitinimonas arctica]QDQ27981.1 hypothetical protein FNU76_17420 [Chitinimonas arctica]
MNPTPMQLTVTTCRSFNDIDSKIYTELEKAFGPKNKAALFLKEENRTYFIERIENGQYSFSSKRDLSGKSLANRFFSGIRDFISRGCSFETRAQKIAEKLNKLSNEHANETLDICVEDAKKLSARNSDTETVGLKSIDASPVIELNRNTKIQTGTMQNDMISYAMGSTYRQADPNNDKEAAYVGNKEGSDCVMSAIGKNNQPIMAVLDGYGRGESRQNILTIGKMVMSILNNITHTLEGENWPEAQIKTKLMYSAFREVNEEFQASHRFGTGASFGAMTFYKGKNNELHAIGFGTGNVLAQLERENTNETLLQGKNIFIRRDENTDLYPMAFPSWHGKTDFRDEGIFPDLEIASRLLTFFDITVQENDQFLFFTKGACKPVKSDSLKDRDVQEINESGFQPTADHTLKDMIGQSDMYIEVFYGLGDRAKPMGDDATVVAFKAPSMA